MHVATTLPPRTKKVMESMYLYFNVDKTKSGDAIFEDLLPINNVTAIVYFLAQKGVDSNVSFKKCKHHGNIICKMTPLERLALQGTAVILQQGNYYWMDFYKKLYQKKVFTLMETLLIAKANPNSLYNVDCISKKPLLYSILKHDAKDSPILATLLKHGLDVNKSSLPSKIVALAKIEKSCVFSGVEKNSVIMLFLIRKWLVKKYGPNSFPKPILMKLLEYLFQKKLSFLLECQSKKTASMKRFLMLESTRN